MNDRLSSAVEHQIALRERLQKLFTLNDPRLRLLLACSGLSLTALVTQYLAAKAAAARKHVRPVSSDPKADVGQVSAASKADRYLEHFQKIGFPLAITAAQLLLFKGIKSRYAAGLLKWTGRLQVLISAISLSNLLLFVGKNYLPGAYATLVQSTLARTKWSFNLTRNNEKQMEFSASTLGWWTTAVTLALAASEGYKPRWWTNNLLAMGASWSSIAFGRRSSFKWELAHLAYFSLLDLLLVDHSHKLFEGNVMTKLQENLQGPVSFLWPLTFKKGGALAKLGTGDVVIPGALIALAAKFDSAVAGGDTNDVWTPSYFGTAIGGYAIGLVSASYAATKRGTPALVHLGPATALPILALAWYRGDLARLMNFREADAGARAEE